MSVAKKLLGGIGTESRRELKQEIRRYLGLSVNLMRLAARHARAVKRNTSFSSPQRLGESHRDSRESVPAVLR
jgi:hypothetical protein